MSSNLGNIFEVDTSRRESDWDNIYDMLDDIQAYVNRTQDFVVNADDPGYQYNPPKAARIGFISLTKLDHPDSNYGKEWTIRISNAGKKITPPKHWEFLRPLLKSVEGRIKLVDLLNGKERSIE